ncbi:class I SAM-dependent methyltransferase [Alteromonas lipotrueiana]|uniref:class I SAM-dependent methyltransferase n=1 Tax=Alteromonas lipotrueiana TaxID=2803815 RepID=UPI001C476118
MNVQMLSDTSEEKAILTRCIAAKEPTDRPLQILEAGCGNKWQLRLSNISYILTGIDVDQEAVALRQRRYNDLNHVIIGDLRYIDLPHQKFDIIYTAFVLEHVHNVEQVLNNFCQWLRPGGLLIIKVPDRDTVYGFAARVTPHWLHVMYYRFFKGNKNAGKPGYLPYPTVYDKTLGKRAFKAFCKNNELTIEAVFAKNNYLRKRSFRDRIVRVFVQLVSLFSFGRLAWHYNDLIYIVEKEKPGQT